MDGKSDPCVHRRSTWCLARSIKINFLRNAFGRYVMFSKAKKVELTVVLLLWHYMLVSFFPAQNV
jgi:hypothetical protein